MYCIFYPVEYKQHSCNQLCSRNRIKADNSREQRLSSCCLVDFFAVCGSCIVLMPFRIRIGIKKRCRSTCESCPKFYACWKIRICFNFPVHSQQSQSTLIILLVNVIDWCVFTTFCFGIRRSILHFDELWLKRNTCSIVTGLLLCCTVGCSLGAWPGVRL